MHYLLYIGVNFKAVRVALLVIPDAPKFQNSNKVVSEDFTYLLFTGFSFKSFQEFGDKLLNLFAIKAVNLFHCPRVIDHCQKINHLLFFMEQTFIIRNSLQRTFNNSCKASERCLYKLLILYEFSLKSTFYDMQVCRLFTVSADVIKHHLYFSATLSLLFLVRNHRG